MKNPIKQPRHFGAPYTALDYCLTILQVILLGVLLALALSGCGKPEMTRADIATISSRVHANTRLGRLYPGGRKESL